MGTTLLGTAIAVVAVAAVGCADERAPSSAPTPTPTATAASPATATPSFSVEIPPACASPAPRSLIVCPSSGPVGTKVVVTGNACNDPHVDSLMLTFERLEGDQPPGAAEITREAAVGPDGRVAVEWVIPATVGEVQNSGGGPTTLGTYTVLSRPPLYPDPCRVRFVVT